MTHSRRTIKALLDKAGHSPRRDLGQNYVADPNTVRKIARLAGVGPGDCVVEIGAGLGSLTLALAETGAQVTAVEVDGHVLPTLREVTAEVPNVAVVEGDATRIVWDELLDSSHDWVLVANLPYNVATPLVLDILDTVPQVARMLVMIQREVAERLAAGPGSKTYGAASVKVSYWGHGRLAGLVPATVFVPRPNVESALVEITRRGSPATDAPYDTLFRLVRTGFGQRRKMLRRSLAAELGDAATAEQVFASAGVDPTARPETLDVTAWGRLATALTATVAAAAPSASPVPSPAKPVTAAESPASARPAPAKPVAQATCSPPTDHSAGET